MMLGDPDTAHPVLSDDVWLDEIEKEKRYRQEKSEVVIACFARSTDLCNNVSLCPFTKVEVGFLQHGRRLDWKLNAIVQFGLPLGCRYHGIKDRESTLGAVESVNVIENVAQRSWSMTFLGLIKIALSPNSAKLKLRHAWVLARNDAPNFSGGTIISVCESTLVQFENVVPGELGDNSHNYT